jgi:hypothetical protein
VDAVDPGLVYRSWDLHYQEEISEKYDLCRMYIVCLRHHGLVVSTGAQIHRVPSPAYSDRLRRQCRERLLCCLADLTQLSIVTKTAEKVQRLTGITSDGQLWLSRVVQIIRKLEQDSKHVALLSELDQDDRGELERAHRTVAWLSKVHPSFVLLVTSSEISVC